MGTRDDYDDQDDGALPSPPRVNKRLGHYPLTDRYYETYAEKVVEEVGEDEPHWCCAVGLWIRLGCCVFLVVVIVMAATLPSKILPLLRRHKHKEERVRPFGVFNYTDAVSKSMLFFDAQKSGKLEGTSNPFPWRGDSCINDGLLAAQATAAPVDLSGGYYDAGDTVKFVYPQAFAITMLAWSYLQYKDSFVGLGEREHMQALIQQGTDFLSRCHTADYILYIQVGDGNYDHSCWQRPEDITYERPVYAVNLNTPGTDVVAETCAALAAGSMAMRDLSADYAASLLKHAVSLWQWATNLKIHQGNAGASFPQQGFYNGTDYLDELLWCTGWLYKATKNITYLNYVTAKNATNYMEGKRGQGSGAGLLEFSWNQKSPGFLLLMSELLVNASDPLPDPELNVPVQEYKTLFETSLCQFLDPPRPGFINVTTPGGLLYLPFLPPFGLTQYAVGTGFLAFTYGSLLSKNDPTTLVTCANGTYNGTDIKYWAKTQADYLLGANPAKTSYMVGFGPTYPERVHHRGASIPSFYGSAVKSQCRDGVVWLFRDAPNPNEITGALVGGPNDTDHYFDDRNNYLQNEPTLAGNAPWVGLLAGLAGDVEFNGTGTLTKVKKS